MPLPKNSSKDAIIRELLRKYEETGKIGNVKPRNKQHAKRIAVKIAMER